MAATLHAGKTLQNLFVLLLGAKKEFLAAANGSHQVIAFFLESLY